jgi:hypothetical protein
MAAASLSAFAMPTYAAAAEQSSAQDTQAWCDVVPPFCGCNNNARCRPGPCQGTVTGDRARNDQGICAAKRED